MNSKKIHNYYLNNLKESIKVKEKLLSQKNKFSKIYNLFYSTLESGNKIIFAGNGGSAADAQHLATELTVRYKYNRRALSAISLATDTSAITAIGNDFGFQYIFSRQIEAIGNKGDLFVAISTSGSSKNIVYAAKAAKKKGVKIVSLLGKKKTILEKYSDAFIKVPSLVTARIQECHIFIGQVICGLIEENFKKD